MDKLIACISETFSKMNIRKVLDVGTGRGNFAEALADCFNEDAQIIGIDSSENAIKYADENKTKKNISFLKMDAEELEFQNNSFDIVCISNTLHHLPNLNKVLNEMKRVLKPDGYFIINEMFSDNLSQKQQSHVLLHHFAAEIEMLQGGFHDKTFEKKGIIKIVENLGIKRLKEIEYITHDEQILNTSKEEEKENLDNCFNAIKKKIETIDDFTLREKFYKKFNEMSSELYNIGFLLATELLIIAKNKDDI